MSCVDLEKRVTGGEQKKGSNIVTGLWQGAMSRLPTKIITTKYIRKKKVKNVNY